jgi:hypothetical protein
MLALDISFMIISPGCRCILSISVLILNCFPLRSDDPVSEFRKVAFLATDKHCTAFRVHRALASLSCPFRAVT